MAFNLFQKNDSEPRKWAALISSLAIIFFLLLLMTAPVAAYQLVMKDRIYRGVTIDGVPVGGLSREEAKERIQKAVNEVVQNGVSVRYEGRTSIVRLVHVGLNDPDLIHDLVQFDIDSMVEEAYGYGRGESLPYNLKQQGVALFGDQVVRMEPAIDRSHLDEILDLSFPNVRQSGNDAKLVFDGDAIKVEPENPGTDFDLDSFYSQLNSGLSLSQPVEIELILKKTVPVVTKSEVEMNLIQVTKFLDKEKITLTYEDKKWEIKATAFKPYLYFAKQNEVVFLKVEEEGVSKILSEVSEEINIPARDAKMEFKDGKVTSFEPSSEGWEVKIEETTANIISEVFFAGKSTAPLVIDIAKPKVEVQDLNDLGIKEMIGVGVSDYAGSPANRRHNIAVGGAAVDGSLILPGEEFSLLKTLGAINAKSGYKQELVIKGNKTIPEYGGGLCQIGTTVFRGALDAGLKITARQNHSYRVGYYEPAGTDATIYDPAPDFRFLNDTGYAVIINTVNDTKNSKLYFQFWGTKDGRLVEQTKPVIYNIKPPPPTKYIETTDLKPGQKRCTESAHSGADAYFIRTITRPDGTVEEEKFKSHYRPWQAVCLIGVEKLTEPEPDPTAGGSIDSPAADAPVNSSSINAPQTVQQ